MSNKPNWRTGEGYPSENTPLNDWRLEFCKRKKGGLKDVPRFEISLPEQKIELFNYPVIHMIQDDGSIADQDSQRNYSTRMIIEFAIDEDIERQLETAKNWLLGDQSLRYKKVKLRLDKWLIYIRLLDASSDNVTQSEMACFIYPHLSNNYPEFSANKQVSKSLKTAKKIVELVCLGKLLRK